MTNVLATLRESLARMRTDLHARFDQGEPGYHITAQHAKHVDEIVLRAWSDCITPQQQKSLTLVAVGGYGRGELFPHSDIDLMLLCADPPEDEDAEAIARFLRLLWDIGLEPGHSVRTLDDCEREARADVTVYTNLTECRRLTGNTARYRQLGELLSRADLWPPRAYYDAKLAEQRARHRRFHDTAYNLEPNIKEGPGGLRDLHTLAWVSQRLTGTRKLHDLVARGLLSESEYSSLLRGQQHLTQIRCSLHYLAGRREDRLLFDHQRALAANAGLADRPGALAVEQYMQDYYRTVKGLSRLNEILLQGVDEALAPEQPPGITPINRRFQSRDGFLEVTRNNVFERSPFALLELFLILEQQPDLKGVRADTLRLLRDNLDRVDDKFRNDLACRSLFMEILKQPQGVTHALRHMNAWGVLGAVLPVFGRIVGQMQHDLFHVYTVDEHILMVVRNLRRFTVPGYAREFPFASRLMATLVKPERLLVAALFHDIAKGRGGDHSSLGENEALEFCRHHGLGDYDARFVAWLVRHHLLMSDTAQRRDISDPGIVHEFASIVGDPARLANLYLLTVADMRGTSPAVWNAWKDRLLIQLYNAALQTLQRGLAEPLDTAQRSADLKHDALALLVRAGVREADVLPHWARLEPAYFLRYDAEALAWHALEITRAAAIDLPVVATRCTPGSGGTEFLIFMPDQDGLFVHTTAGFDRMNLSIQEARIHTTRLGYALDTYVVLDHNGLPVTDPGDLADLAVAMRTQLLAPQPGRDISQQLLPRTLKAFPIETRVTFSAGPGGQSLLEVTAQDRPGLLHQIACALRDCDVRLNAARVATYGERAEDVFVVTTRDGGTVNDETLRACLRNSLLTPAEVRPLHARVVK